MKNNRSFEKDLDSCWWALILPLGFLALGIPGVLWDILSRRFLQ